MTLDELAQIETVLKEFAPGEVKQVSIQTGTLREPDDTLRVKLETIHEGTGFIACHDLPLKQLDQMPKSFIIEIAARLIRLINQQIIVRQNEENAA